MNKKYARTCIAVVVGVVALPLGGCSLTNSDKDAASEGALPNNLHVITVPVDGEEITCIVAAQRAATAQAISCDWDQTTKQTEQKGH